MDTERLGRLSRQILADILAVGSVATAGPAWSPAQEADILRAVEARLRALFARHGHEDDSALAERFRREHPDLFTGSPADRHRAAKKGRD